VRSKLLCVVLATIMILSGTVIPMLADTTPGVDTTSRLAGQDHYQTSVAIAEAYNNNGDCGNVILASGDSFSDALSANILSKKMNAPILLVGTTVNASSDAFNYLYTHESRQRGTVYIIGGTGVIGPDFETKLASMMFTNIKRLGGTDRYDTNMLIVNEVNVSQCTPVCIASGENFPDALSIASYSGSKQYPTLLVGADYLPEKTKNYLLSEKPSSVYITGGTSVVSQDLESQINALVPGATVARLAGNDRFGTNAAVLNGFSPAPDTIYLASGDDFQDVLAGSALAAKTGNPIILVDNQLSTLPTAVEAYLEKLNGSGIQPNIISIGGTDVVPDVLFKQGENAFSDRGNNGSKDKPQINVNPRIAAGWDTAYYLDSSGHVWDWGGYGEISSGLAITSSPKLNPVCSTVPVQVSNLSDVVSIAAGNNSGYALDSSGNVWTWGSNYSGQLGNGTTSDSSTPVKVSNLSNIVAIAAKDVTNYALDGSGHVWTWGSNFYGQLGNGTSGGKDISTTPVQISKLTNINIVAIAAGPVTGYALDSSGHVWAWGDGIYGELGNGTTTDLKGPVQVPNLPKIVAIDGGVDGYALDDYGYVWSWGENLDGSLGKGISSNLIITGPAKVSNLSNIVAIAAGGDTQYALDGSDHVWSWGHNYGGQLGNNTVKNNTTVPVQVSNLKNIVSIAGGFVIGYALDSSGHVWAWGEGNYGQFGNGTSSVDSFSITPVQVSNLPPK